MKRRIIAFVLAMSFCMPVVACGDDGHSRRKDRDKDDQEETDETEEPESTIYTEPTETSSYETEPERPIPTECHSIDYDMMYSHEGDAIPGANGWYYSLSFDFNYIQITDQRFSEAINTVNNEYSNTYAAMNNIYLEECERFYEDIESEGAGFGYSYTNCIPYRVDDIAISYKVVTRPEPGTYDGEGYSYTNIDTVTGGYIALENIVTDMDEFKYELIEGVECMVTDTSMFVDNYEDVIGDMLSSGELPFLLDVDGIVIPFDYGTIIEGGYGATIDIKIPYYYNEDIIDPFYFSAKPDCYSTNFYYDGTCNADIDNDGDMDVIRFSDDSSPDYGMITSITVSCNGESATTEAYEFSPHAKLVCNHGKYYVLVTVDSSSDWEDIYSFSLEDGHPVFVDRISGFLPQYVNPSCFTVTSRCHCLSTMDSRYDVAITDDGHLQRLTDYVTTITNIVLVTATPITGYLYDPGIEAVDYNTEITLPVGTGIKVIRTDEQTYADIMVVDGPEHLTSIIRVDVDLNYSHDDPELWGQLINGIPADDAFEVTFYAG